MRNVTETRITADGARTRLSINGNVDFTNSVVLETKSGEAAGIEIKDGNHGSFSQVNVVGEGKLQINDTARLSIGTLNVADEASASLQVWGSSSAGTATYSLDNVVLGDNSALKASYYQDNFPILHIDGSLNVQMGSGSTVDFAGKSKADWRSDGIVIDAPQMTFTVTDLADPGKVYLTKSGTDLTTTAVTVVGDSDANTGNAKADLETLSGIVSLYDSETTDEYVAEGVKLEVEANDIFDGASAVVGEGGSLTDVVVVENDNVHGLAETAALGLHMWRNEMNDVGKRLGDVRASKGLEKAAWARMYTGKATFGGRGIENKYTAVQVGYDQAVAPECRIGAAFSYTDGSNDFATGGGDNSIAALTVYGSWFDEKGSFLDVSGKFGRLDNEFSAALSDGVSKADYNADAWSFTVETGHRFDVSEMLFIEPQFELMYGRVESVDYTTSTGVAVEHDSAETLVGRAGVVMGFKCPSDKGNVYMRASVLHDWKGEADYAFSKNGHKRALSENLGGTWYEYGVGANLKFSDALYGYADVEAADGGEVDTDYRVNLGVRYAF